MTSPGATLGSYRIDRQLGRGGMGAVFLAYDSTLRRQVALKVTDDAADDEASQGHLLREARNAAALNHANICTIHEVGCADGTTFIAMEAGCRISPRRQHQTRGDRVRISVNVIRVSDHTQVWTDSFDREVSSILSVQNDVALGVASGLAMRLLPAQQSRLTQARSIDPAAYEAYLQGASHVDRLTLADLNVALGYFETALAKDPTYALAHVGVYRVWATRQQLIPAMRREADQARRAALNKALEFGESLPEVHAAVAGQAVTDWDWAAADRSFRRAIDLNPSFAEVRASYSQLLNQMKRPVEALAQIERAIQIDALNPTVQTYYGLALDNANRPKKPSCSSARSCRSRPIRLSRSLDSRGALLRLGRQNEALAVQRTRAAVKGDTELEDALEGGGRGRGGRGDSDAALRSAVEVYERRWRNRENVNEVQVAIILIRLKENEQALDWLERAFDSHNPNLPGINNRRPFDPLRGHPRFNALLRRMNLPS